MAGIRMTGMTSGLDTESIVQAMVMTHKSKKEKVEKKQQKLEWSQEIWKNTNSKIYSMYTGLDKLRFSGSFKMKKATSSDNSKVKVTAGSDAVVGASTVKVKQLATTGSLTGGKLKLQGEKSGKVTKDTKLSDLGAVAGSELSVKYDGKTKDITVTSDTTVQDFVDKLKEAGVNAAFDETEGRFFISSKKAGESNDFSLEAKYLGDKIENVNGNTTLSKLGLVAKSDSEIAALKKQKSYGVFDENGNLDKVATKKAIRQQYEDLQSRYDAANLETDDTRKSKMLAAIEEEKNANPFFAGLSLQSDDAYDAADAAFAGIEQAVKSLETNDSEGAIRVSGQDSKIVLNGVTHTSESGTFQVNGLTIEALAVTGDEEIKLNTSTDSDAVYDKFKEFLGQYNDLINELQGMFNAESAKGYEPLTEDQKDEMSDEEIEKWETKIKDSLLRRDTTLRDVIGVMSNSMSQSYSIKMSDGSTQKMGLASIGIHTLGLLNSKTNEQYAYHIDGDEDDETTSGKEDKFRAFIEKDPDAAADLLSQSLQGLYKALDTKIGMKTSENSSAFTIYNDKQMKRDLDSYKSTIKEWEKKIEEQEDRYYKKFAAMEKALTNLNSSQSALGGMLG